jgi:Leucine-rich repeat (LRR) protein
VHKWEELFEERFVDRGRAYFDDGKVLHVTQTETGYSVKVGGDEIYSVGIELTDGVLSGLTCDCPYAERGNRCKHMAAVLFRLTADGFMDSGVPFDVQKLAKAHPAPDLDTFFEKLTDPKIRVTFCHADKDVKKEYKTFDNAHRAICEKGVPADMEISWANKYDIPESIGDLTLLRVLKLIHVKELSLPDSVRNLVHLEKLELTGTNFGELPRVIFGLPSLKHLRIFDSDISVLPDEIKGLKQLERLDIGGTNITKIPESIGSLTELTSMRITDVLTEKLPESMRSLKKLKYLELWNIDCDLLPDSIGSFDALEGLDLRLNNLSVLPDFEMNLPSLSSLSVSWKRNGGVVLDFTDKFPLLTDLNIGGGGAFVLKGSFDRLENLWLRCANISSVNFKGMPVLRQLDASYSALKELPDMVGELRTLRRLLLNSTKLTALPESIGNLTSLKELNLNSTAIVRLPESIGKLRSLRTLDMNGTPLTSLPESIGNLKSLKELLIDSAEIEQFPKSMKSLNLDRLDVYGEIYDNSGDPSEWLDSYFSRSTPFFGKDHCHSGLDPEST